MLKSFRKLITCNYADISKLSKEQDYAKTLQEFMHIVVLIFHLYFTEKGKPGPCY